MKKVSIYNVYLDDGHDTYKIVVPAETKKAAIDYVRGNGDIIAVKEDKETYINVDRLVTDLEKCGWTTTETDILQRLIAQTRLDMPRK